VKRDFSRFPDYEQSSEPGETVPLSAIQGHHASSAIFVAMSVPGYLDLSATAKGIQAVKHLYCSNKNYFFATDKQHDLPP
jgi:hypothetical protein